MMLKKDVIKKTIIVFRQSMPANFFIPRSERLLLLSIKGNIILHTFYYNTQLLDLYHKLNNFQFFLHRLVLEFE